MQIDLEALRQVRDQRTPRFAWNWIAEGWLHQLRDEFHAARARGRNDLPEDVVADEVAVWRCEIAQNGA